MNATIQNMRQHYAEGVFAYSPFTGEESSANPGDYFWLGEDDPLIDSLGQAMILATRSTRIIEITS